MLCFQVSRTSDSFVDCRSFFVSNFIKSLKHVIYICNYQRECTPNVFAFNVSQIEYAPRQSRCLESKRLMYVFVCLTFVWYMIIAFNFHPISLGIAQANLNPNWWKMNTTLCQGYAQGTNRLLCNALPENQKQESQFRWIAAVVLLTSNTRLKYQEHITNIYLDLWPSVCC